ncbi:hypothetical protein SLEP1_g24594 [Rubroshorea leprosula]|uniref:Uncharacterized protein n=1 Tax=Rubroshorea leprosula TaxID=152421 RepID=A0AAV5JRP4_9ROSI|nr:hypothetical protein SLEP1_g24594 [Rubroshorea leprosula]
MVLVARTDDTEDPNQENHQVDEDTGHDLALEVRLEILDDILVQHEGLSKNIRINGWIDLKTEFCNYDCAWILATQTRKGNSRSFPYVGLEVNQTNRENKYISLVQHFGEETVTILIR